MDSKNLVISRSNENPAVLIAVCQLCGQIVGVGMKEENFESTAREHVCPPPEKKPDGPPHVGHTSPVARTRWERALRF